MMFDAHDWDIASQALEIVKARAKAEGRPFDRDELAAEIGKQYREERNAKRWKERALRAEKELRELRGENVASQAGKGKSE